MKCKICGHEKIAVIYNDYIRDGAVETLTENKYKMFQCEKCGVIWHDINEEVNAQFYQSAQYRLALEKDAAIGHYYELHDREVLEKLQYTGTDIFRNKIVADIGCGGGSFLDFVSGAAAKTIGIEPSSLYREQLVQKGHDTYAYASQANADYKGAVDVITSFDVIEHVDNPLDFLKDVYNLLKCDGKGYAVIGTPSDAPVMRELLGKVYEQKLLYSFQHPWILSEKSYKILCEKAGFSEIRIVQKQRYGMGNMISWLLYKKPAGHSSYDFISETLDGAYRNEIEKAGLADYLIAYLKK